MQGLAAQLKFEEAHELKKKYDLVERYRSKSVIVSQVLDSVDVFGVSDDGGRDVYVNHIHVRRGAVVRSVTLQYHRSMDEPADMLLSYAISEIAARFGSVCDEVIVGEMPDAEFPGSRSQYPSVATGPSSLRCRGAMRSRAGQMP